MEEIFDNAPSPDFDSTEYLEVCPDGEWTGRLDHKDWRASGKLDLYITNQITGEKCLVLVLQHEGYADDHRRVDFHSALVGAGDIFDLAARMRPDGTIGLVSAFSVSAESVPGQVIRSSIEVWGPRQS